MTAHGGAAVLISVSLALGECCWGEFMNQTQGRCDIRATTVLSLGFPMYPFIGHTEERMNSWVSCVPAAGIEHRPWIRSRGTNQLIRKRKKKWNAS